MRLPSDPYNIRLSGRGGQGILLAGIILSDAAMKEGFNVVQTQSYGPEARLGASKCEVILSTGEIAFPEVETPDLLLCLSIDAYQKYGRDLAEDGLRVVEQMVTSEQDVNDARIIPAIDTAVDLGNRIAANMVALGYIVALSEIVSGDNLFRAMEERVKPAYLEINRRALEKGMQMGREVAVQDK